MKVVLSSTGECPSEWCKEPGDEGPRDVVGLAGALCGCPTVPVTMGARCRTSALSGPDCRCGPPALLKSRLAYMALYPSHTPEALGNDGFA